MTSEERELRPSVIRGIAALDEMLNQIGNTDGGDDKKVAQILCDNETDLRNFLQSAVYNISQDI